MKNTDPARSSFMLEGFITAPGYVILCTILSVHTVPYIATVINVN